MRWIFGILVAVLLIIISLGMLGSGIVNLPRTHDPFPASVRTQLDTLNDERRVIERLAVAAKTFSTESDLLQERPNYDELADDANAWLKTAGDGLDLHQVDTQFLSQTFEEHLIPKAKELIEKLKSKQLKRSELQAGDFGDSVSISAVEKGFDYLKIYFELIGANDAKSIGIAKRQLDEMKWRVWSEL